MFKSLPLRTKLIAIVVPPLVVLGLIAMFALVVTVRGAASIDALSGDIRILGGIAGIGLLIGVLGVIAISRTITDPLEDIRASAVELAEIRLPLLIEVLRTPGATAPAFAPIEHHTDDELGKLVAALNDVQTAAANVADEQRKIVRRGLNELVVNLARRNQSLVDRQIESIDGLESAEQDPDKLEALFGLDHLATRMRRNAESLLVLAGAEAPRRRGGPIATTDILRVAMSEIEDYRRVRLGSVDDGQIGSQSAADLAHLCSELMENATQFSPPDQFVTISGIAQSDGHYLICIADQGIGMNEAQLATANGVLLDPPELGLDLARSLGFIVVGRLARRLDARVELTSTAGGGVTALVLVPPALLGNAVATAVDTPTQAAGSAAGSGDHTPPSPSSVSGFEQPDGEEPWSPPTMPQRGANPLLERGSAAQSPAPQSATPQHDRDPFPASASAPDPFSDSAPIADPFAPAASAVPPEHQADAERASQPIVPDQPEIKSEALAKLMGLIPPSTESASEPTSWDGAIFDPTPLPRADVPPPSRLDDAIPTGDAFDSGVDSLLHGQTAGGLTKRDRTQPQAPVSEGRSVTASVRSPDEIRQMLARYRDGRARPSTERSAGDHDQHEATPSSDGHWPNDSIPPTNGDLR